ncbi:solute carrier family 13 member 3-like [Aplysia californica]|uniref:Solute carrier family 13 member 3-like n=1 Tax=Aplysia californica TaxID=6500 RepID=A0ABM1A523_APLCA|nr:solute carrier family 13 member 3-like [Aplysia californica]
MARFAEKAVIGHFAVLVTLWLSMKMPGGVGWNSLFTPGFVNNSTSGVIILTSLFIFPSQRPRIFGGNSGTVEGNSKSDSCPTLLEWENVQQMFPWGTFCLIGGGYALAATCQALNLGMNPLYLMVPGVLASSMAFMLPVATPPNTIVFATGHIKASDMGKAGFILNVLCVLVINVGANTWIWSYLNLDQLPPEMNRSSTALPTLWAETTPHSTDVFPTNVTA